MSSFTKTNQTESRTAMSALCLALACSMFASCLAADDPRIADHTTASQLAAIHLTDTSGIVHAPFSDDSTNAVALIFVSTDCPIANSFQPTLQKLHQEFTTQGIAFFMVYCSPNVTAQAIEKHRAEYRIKMPAALDASQTIGRLTAAKVTPESIVIDRQGRIIYRGLINNLYAGYGKKRRQATAHYLRDAFESLLRNAPIATQRTKPLGCFIRYENPDHPTGRNLSQ